MTHEARAGAPEIIATLEMIEAGAAVLAELDGEVSRLTLAKRVWGAMARVSRPSEERGLAKDS
jgi:hypothetical protein